MKYQIMEKEEFEGILEKLEKGGLTKEEVGHLMNQLAFHKSEQDRQLNDALRVVESLEKEKKDLININVQLFKKLGRPTPYEGEGFKPKEKSFSEKVSLEELGL